MMRARQMAELTELVVRSMWICMGILWLSQQLKERPVDTEAFA